MRSFLKINADRLRDGNHISTYTPCIYIPCCQRLCEESAACRKCGSCGFEALGEPTPRLWIFRLTAVISLTALILQICAATAISTDTDNLRRVHWSKGSVTSPLGNTDVFIGISSVSICGQVRNVTDSMGNVTQVYDSGCESISWSSNNCDQSSIGADNDACNECKSLVSSLTVFCVMGALGMAGAVSDKVDRIYRNTDLNCVKCFGLITAVLGTVFPLLEILPFQGTCVDNLPSEIMGQSITWRRGPGFIMVMVSLIINFVVSIFVHTTVPTPKEIHQEGYKMSDPREDDGEEDEHKNEVPLQSVP